MASWKHNPLRTYFRGTVRVTCRSCNVSSPKFRESFEALADEKAREWWSDHTRIKERQERKEG